MLACVVTSSDLSLGNQIICVPSARCRGVVYRGVLCRGVLCRGVVCRGVVCRGVLCRGVVCRGVLYRGVVCTVPDEIRAHVPKDSQP